MVICDAYTLRVRLAPGFFVTPLQKVRGLVIMRTQMTPTTDRLGSWIQCSTGTPFYPLDPREEEIFIEDIARGLSQQCRFTGQTNRFYSIAQHSIAVSYIVPPGLALRGLLHDASEAYLCDIARPLKRLPYMEEYRRVERNLQDTIYRRYKIAGPDSPELHDADARALGAEALELMSPLTRPEEWAWATGIASSLSIFREYMPPDVALVKFLNRFAELYPVRSK